MKDTIIACVLLLSAATPACSLPFTYSAGPTEGTIVDAETKKPVTGAVVIAMWDLEGGMEGVSRIATLKVIEAVTDERGHYRIPGWGPVPRPLNGVLDSYDPAILIFKTGYEPEQLLNDMWSKPRRRAHLVVHDSAWNGKAIALRKYEGPLKTYSRKVSFILDSLANVTNGRDCAWKQIPKMVRALEDEHKRELAAGINPTFTAPYEFLMMRKACAPLDEFNRAYLGTN